MVDRISTEISVADFQALYLGPNKPCILSADFTKDWKSKQEWVKEGKPNFRYLDDSFGDCKVPVADCSKKHFNAHEKVTMNFRQFLEYWEQTIVSEDDNDKLFYLKDWHFQREFPEYRAYEVLKYFQADWLNEWYDQSEQSNDDYRFIYMGPKGTWTAFHADVLRSYSWSANICGKKKWLLFPPGEEENLKDSLGNLPFDVTSKELRDSKKYPTYHKAAKPIELIQGEGEIVFIPSCWHHQVHNLEDTISINHNWINAYGIEFMFRHLQAELLLVENEISEFKETEDWQQQCQLMLKCTAGLDYEQFARMLVELIQPRFSLIKPFLQTREAKQSYEESKVNFDALLDTAIKCFKRLEVTCVPAEHVKYSSKKPEGPFYKLMKKEKIQENTNEVMFDLEILVRIFQGVYNKISKEARSDSLKKSAIFVEEVHEFVTQCKAR